MLCATEHTVYNTLVRSCWWAAECVEDMRYTSNSSELQIEPPKKNDHGDNNNKQYQNDVAEYEWRERDKAQTTRERIQ